MPRIPSRELIGNRNLVDYELIGFCGDSSLFQSCYENVKDDVVTEWVELVKPIIPGLRYERSNNPSIHLRGLAAYLQSKERVIESMPDVDMSYLENSSKSWRYHNLQMMYRVLGTVIRQRFPHQPQISYDLLPKLRTM